MHCSRRLIVQTLVFSPSYLHRQVSPPQTLVVKGGTTWARNGRWILPENARLPRNIQGPFTCRKSTTWNKRLYFPSEGRCAEDFFALKTPGLNPRTWVPKASTLPVDHRSRVPPDLRRCVRIRNRQRLLTDLHKNCITKNSDKSVSITNALWGQISKPVSIAVFSVMSRIALTDFSQSLQSVHLF